MAAIRDIPVQYQKFEDMNAYAEIWQDKTKSVVRRKHALTKLYNECLKYANNGINETYTVLAGFTEEEPDKKSDYQAKINSISEQIEELKASGGSEKEIERLKREKGNLEAKISEIDEWQEYYNPDSSKKLKKKIADRWKKHDDHAKRPISDIESGWFNVINDAFMEAKEGFENGELNKDGERKPFSQLFISSILNAKKGGKMKKGANVDIRVYGSSLVVDMKDPAVIVLDEKAKEYLKRVSKERNVEGYSMPSHIFTVGALAKELEKLGFNKEEAIDKAEEVLAKRNLSLNQKTENDQRNDSITGHVSSYVDSYEAEKERRREEAKDTLLLISSFCKLAKSDKRISPNDYKYIRYSLTKMFFKADIDEDRFKVDYKDFYDLIDEKFLELLRKDKEEAEDAGRNREKEHVLLAQLLGLESETVRKRLNRASKIFLKYYNEWENKQRAYP